MIVMRVHQDERRQGWWIGTLKAYAFVAYENPEDAMLFVREIVRRERAT